MDSSQVSTNQRLKVLGFRARLARGEKLLNGWVGSSDPLVAEVMGRAGFDSVTLDMQHGHVDDASLLAALQGLSGTPAVPFVRVPWNEPHLAMRALDMGAEGVICPMVNSAEEARAFISACRYPPEGVRSWGPFRAGHAYGADYGAVANGAVLVIAMIETVAALERVEEIAATPGLDAVFVGPSDLSQSLGRPVGGGWNEGVVLPELTRVADVCREHGLPCGVFTKSAEWGKRMFEVGYGFVTVSNDMGYLSAASAGLVAEMTGSGPS